MKLLTILAAIPGVYMLIGMACGAIHLMSQPQSLELVEIVVGMLLWMFLWPVLLYGVWQGDL